MAFALEGLLGFARLFDRRSELQKVGLCSCINFVF